MDTLMQLVTKGNDFLWSFLLLVLLCGTGLYYTIRLRFIQVRKFGEGVRQVFGHFSMNGEKHEKGEMTPFQSIATAIAAQVGTGNLAGAATALIGGGPGAIFWMWISAFLGMATIYGEAVLAQTYKTEVNGEVTGGPVYYIKAAFKGNFGKVLSTLFAIFIVLALGFMGNMVQSNSIGAAFTEVFQVYGINIPPITIGLVLADDSDPDTPPQVYTAEELFAIRDRLIGEFKPYNTAVTVKNEKIISIYRKFMP